MVISPLSRPRENVTTPTASLSSPTPGLRVDRAIVDVLRAPTSVLPAHDGRSGAAVGAVVYASTPSGRVTVGPTTPPVCLSLDAGSPVVLHANLPA
jgi:hypothetical protein